MNDMIIKGTGNSRYLKTIANALTQYPTYEDFMAALITGTFTVDLNGINISGVTQQGTALNKANLLADATATSLGLTSAATPNDAFAKCQANLNAAKNELNGQFSAVYASISQHPSTFEKLIMGRLF